MRVSTSKYQFFMIYHYSVDVTKKGHLVGKAAYPYCKLFCKKYSAEPVLVAQGFKRSRCMATLMEANALGAPLGAWEEGGLVAAQCPSILPEVSGYHTGA